MLQNRRPALRAIVVYHILMPTDGLKRRQIKQLCRAYNGAPYLTDVKFLPLF